MLFLADKILDIAIDYALNRWRIRVQKAHPSSNRYTLRLNTYSPTFKKAKTFLLVVLAIYLTVWIIGINPVVLASAGAVALVLAFLSQNLFKDMLNGLLILSTDRYAIGDLIEVNGMGGRVEDMNLYKTSLRNLDGQLIVIPKGILIRVVIKTQPLQQSAITRQFRFQLKQANEPENRLWVRPPPKPKLS